MDSLMLYGFTLIMAVVVVGLATVGMIYVIAAVIDDLKSKHKK